jgi:3-hydroxy-D-aspartate aldolase
MRSLGPNEPLISKPGSRVLLDTPALCIDLDAMERNIASMAEFCRAKRVALRPHAKTHKSIRIAERQIAAGAIGICCATIGEAEIMVAGGINGVHMTSPQVTPSKIARLVALNLAATDGFSVVVDHPQNLADLAAAASASGKVLDVLVDFSAGHYRTGAATEEDAIVLARAVHGAAGLRLAGLQSYSGNLRRAGRHRLRHRHPRFRCRGENLHRAAGRLLHFHGRRIYPRAQGRAQRDALRDLFVRADRGGERLQRQSSRRLCHH